MVKSIKKVKKNKKRMNKILYLIVGLVIGIFIFTAGTMAMMVKDEIKEKDPGPPPEPVNEAHLFVEDVYFMMDGSRAAVDGDGIERVDIITTVYITNDGLAEAKNVKITAWPMDEDKNMGKDKVDETVGIIPIQKTSEIELTIRVPPGARHNVDFLIFERDLLILRGSGSVVTEGTFKNTPKYQTNEVKGTVNDTDYDGIPDDWERYYGLDPNDLNDAHDDPDGDGVSNLEEYRANTEPRDPKVGGCESDDDKEEKGLSSLDNGAVVGGLGIFIAIIVIIIIIIAVFASSKHEHHNKVNNNPQAYTNQYTPPSILNVQPGQVIPKRCSRCGGWVVNDACTLCGSRYPPATTPTAPEPQIVSETEDVSDTKEENAEWESDQK